MEESQEDIIRPGRSIPVYIYKLTEAMVEIKNAVVKKLAEKP